MSIRSFALLSLIALFSFGNVSLANDRFELVADIVGLYQRDARRILGSEIYLMADGKDDEGPNAYASFNGPMGAPRIRLTKALLREFEDEEVAATVCHELGHFFGDLRIGTRDPGLAIEAEADYFAGGCLMRYLTEGCGISTSRAESIAIDIARNEAQAFERRLLNPDRAVSEQAHGILKGYPNANCRLLTVFHGIRGYRRPTCWYNP